MIYFEKTKEKIDFVFWGQDYLSAKRWVYEIDRNIFLKQIETRCWEKHDKTLVKFETHILELMRRKWEQGYIAPEYGADGGCGIHHFYFVPDGKFCSIEVYHPRSETTWQISSPIYISDYPPDVDNPYPLYYDLGEFLEPDKHIKLKDYGLQLTENKDLIGITYSICGKEYENLKYWKNWKENRAFSGRYKYLFSTTSIGTGVRVNDFLHDTSINITDYSSW